MLADARPMAFVATADPEGARAFYGDVLGLELLEDTPFALVFRAGPIVLRIQKVPQVAPPPGTAFGWTVPAIAESLATLRKRGVTALRFPGMEQDDAGVWTAPDGARIAWFRDPDGNVLSLTQDPAGA